MILKRALEILFLIPVILCLSPRAALAIQPSECSDKEMSVALKASDPAYPDAMELAQTLRDNGITVNCVLPSKMINQFKGQTGAVLYRTSRGDFEALFLIRPRTFDRLRIIERQDGSWWMYSFKGPPQPRQRLGIQSAYPFYFVKYQNMLFVLIDKEMSATLETLVHAR
jgi:hypothetical protein